MLNRIVLVLSVAGALGVIAFGPRSSRQVPPGRTVVTYWEKWTDAEGEALRRLVAVFNETVGQRENIYVDHVTTTQIDLKTLVAAAGGDPPDLAGLWPHNVASFAAHGALSALDERAAADGLEPNLFVPVYYNQGRYHGRLYSVPLTPWSLALYYNQDLFDAFAPQLQAKGLDPTRPPRTLDELRAYSEVIQRRNARGHLEVLGFLPATPETIGWYWNTWGLWAGGRFTDADGYPRFDTAACDTGYQWVADFARAIGQTAILRFEASLGNFNSPDNPFMRGRLAMMLQGPWFANMIRQYGPNIRYAAAPFPTLDGSQASYCGQDVLVIPAGARHPEAAWRFIVWLYQSPPIHVPSGKAQPQFGYEYYLERTPTGFEQRPMPALRPVEWLCWNHFKNSPLAQSAPEFVATHPNPALAVHEELARLPAANADPPLSNWTALQAEFVAAYRDIWSGAAPSAAARLTKCQQRVEQLVELERRRLACYGESYP